MPVPNSITFFYPSKIVGGAEYLYIRLAKHLSEFAGVKTYVIDYKDGFLRSQLNGSAVQIIDFTTTEQLVIDFDTTIITPLNHLPGVNRIKNQANVSVFFWSIHPTHLTAFFENRNWFINESGKKRISAALKQIIGKGGMVFMDAPNYYTNNGLLNLNLARIPYLPITCNAYEGEKKQFVPDEEITISWVGRIAVDKVGAIINMALHINLLPDEVKKKVHFVIIGNGPEEKRLYEVLRSLDIKYTIKGTVINNELNEYLLQQVDIGFAMGTSALEFAKLKIPVILADVFLGEGPLDNQFQWLYNTTGFSLGEPYSPSAGRNLTLNELLATCSSKEQYTMEAERCYQYYEGHFEIGAITNKLLGYISENKVLLKSGELSTIGRIMNPWFFLILKKIKSYLQ